MVLGNIFSFFLDLVLLVFDPEPNFAGYDFINWHRTVEVGGPVEKIFRPSNGVSGTTQSMNYQSGLSELREIVAQAQRTRRDFERLGQRVPRQTPHTTRTI